MYNCRARERESMCGAFSVVPVVVCPPDPAVIILRLRGGVHLTPWSTERDTRRYRGSGAARPAPTLRPTTP